MFIPLVLGTLIGVASTSPIKLSTCEVWAPTVGQTDNGPETIGAYVLHVRFSNTTQQPISRVTFTLNDGRMVSDVGTFSPGITINHLLPLKGTDAASCSVFAADVASGLSSQTSPIRGKNTDPTR